jgi:hypothetical protein
MSITAVTIKAQDIIKLKDGNQISSNVLEIDKNTIKYKKYSNLDGPTYNIEVGEVVSIKYENGEKDFFQAKIDDDIEHMSEPLVSPDNVEIINKFSRILNTDKLKAKKKSAKFFITKYAVSQNSVMSNEDLEIFFKMPHLCLYEIWIKNKTDQTLIIDLQNTFSVTSNNRYNQSRVYFSQSETVSVSEGNMTGTGFNLGAATQALGIGGVVGTLANGVSIGAGSSQSATTTYSNERFVIIPPYGTLPLKKWECVEITSGLVLNRRKWISYGENFFWDTVTMPADYNLKTKVFIRSFPGALFESIKEYTFPDLTLGRMRCGESQIYDPSNSPLIKDYSIRYYKGNQTKDHFTIQFTLYARQVIGMRHDMDIYKSKTYQILNFNPVIDIIGFSRPIDYYSNL